MQLGYARVSSDSQDTVAQVAPRKTAGRKRIYREKASSVDRWGRPELHLIILDRLRKGEFLVLWKPERLASVEAIDTTTPVGRVRGRRQVLSPQRPADVIKTVSRGRNSAAARLFRVHPATLSRLLARAGSTL